MPVCHQCHHVVVQLHVNLNIKNKFKKKTLGEEKPRQIIVKTASDAEIQLYVWGIPIRVRFGVIILGNISRYYFAHSITQSVLKYETISFFLHKCIRAIIPRQYM